MHKVVSFLTRGWYQFKPLLKLSLSDRAITTISYDEKLGIQAIRNIAAQLLPVPGGTYPTIQRDYEYKRLGTLSLLAGQ